jgi:hypothetical protein
MTPALAAILTGALWAPAAFAYWWWARLRCDRRPALLATALVGAAGVAWWLPGLWLGYSWAGQAAGIAAVTGVTVVTKRWVPLPRPGGDRP